MSEGEEPPWRELGTSLLPTPETAGVSLSRRQRALLGVGVLLLLAGILGVLAPGLVGGLDVSTLVLFVAAMLAVGFGVHGGYRRIRRGERATAFPLVETRRDVARPGAEVDDHLREAVSSSSADTTKGYRVSRGHHARKMVRRQVAAVAARVLQHRDRVDEATARDAIEEGTWTRDAVATTLFSGASDQLVPDHAAEDEPEAPGEHEQDAAQAAPGTGRAAGGGAIASGTGAGSTVQRTGAGSPIGGTEPGSTATGPAAGSTDEPVGPPSPVEPLPAATVEGDGGLATRLTSLVGGGPDFESAVRHATASLAESVPGVDAARLSSGRAAVDHPGREWRTGVWDTEHWRGVGSISLLLLGIAVLAEAPMLVLVATVFAGYAGYAWLLEPREPELTVERTVDPAAPTPGDHVTVTVTVRNDGDRLLPDCRVVDPVPDRLPVVDGCARHATALAAGEATAFSYDVLAVAGDHEFGDVTVAVRDPSGQRERSATLATGRTTLSCEPAPVTESVPLHPQASGVVGRVPADVGGSGTAFHTVREYRRGDPLKRIDWNRKARTGELGTLLFDEEHAATVVVLVDVRPESALAAGPDALSAIDRSLAGASQLVETLLADGDRVGVATMGLDWEYLAPATGPAHQATMQALLHREEASRAGGVGYTFNPARYRRRLKRRLPADAQLVCFSPLCDDDAVDLARWLHARGHRVTVFSPDPTDTGTVGGVLAGIDRTLNLSTLRSSGVRVVDWPATETLQTAVERAQGRWSA